MVRKGRKKKHRKPRQSTAAMKGNPHVRGVVLRTFVLDPRKPNSANRKCARVRLINGDEVTAFYPGEREFVKEHDTVLVQPGRVPDLAGIKYRIVPGVYDAPRTRDRKQGRSRYGTKR
jgi:small subunit ribosomal protein S12